MKFNLVKYTFTFSESLSAYQTLIMTFKFKAIQSAYSKMFWRFLYHKILVLRNR